jgi:predicted outer membrane repeat protein
MKFLSILSFFLMSILLQAQTTIFVDANASGTATGMSWDDAYTNLQDALSSAVSGAIIRVAQGTYVPTMTTDRSLSFNIPEGVSLKGGYATGGATRDWQVYRTVLSGDIGTLDVDADNSYHVVLFDAVTNATRMDGFVVQDGYANGNGNTDKRGGGIFTDNAASPSYSNLLLINNFAEQRGGALYITIDSQPSLEAITFEANTSDSSGGALYNDAQPLFLIEQCMFKENFAPSGGAVYNNFRTNTTFRFCQFISNSSEFGGAIYENSGITNTYISNVYDGNSATDSGGAIFNNFESFTTSVNCLFFNNTSEEDGAAVLNGFDSDPTFINSSFISNVATGSGGAIHTPTSSSALALFYNSAFYLNADVNGVSDITGNAINALSADNASDVAGSLLDNSNTFILLTTDPFIDRANPKGDDGVFGTLDDGLFPSETSELTDAGDTSRNAQLEDITTSARVFNGTIDIGAYEFFATLNTNDLVSKEIALYPNPVNDTFELNLTNTIIENIAIYSIQGQLVKTLDAIKATTVTVDISELPSNFYILIAKTAQGKKVLKLTKA